MLSSLGFLFLNFGLASLVAHALLGPVARALAGRPYQWRAQAVDWFTLALLLTLPVALFVWQRENASQPLRWQSLPLLVGMVFVWWRSVAALSQLGVHDSPRRFAFVGVLVPLSLFGSLLMVVLVIRLGMELVMTSQHRAADLVWLALLPLAAVYLACVRRLLAWVLGGAEKPAPKPSEAVLAEVVPARTSSTIGTHD
jgi:hypothetical protein